MSYWPNSYKAFERYEFFLNYHLDALVLKRVFPRSRVVSWPLERWRESENPGPWGYNNDLFWAFSARRYFPPFKSGDG